jgi:hypothetical protein
MPITELQQALMSVKQLADQGYTTIYILTSKESLSMTMTVSNLSQANRHCSKGGMKRGIVDCTSCGGKSHARL